jgi:hypothetical protein
MNSEKETAMSTETADSATVEVRSLRAAQLTRAIVLLIVGLAIAFTAALHEQLGFDIALIVGGLALIGAATIFEYFALRGTAESWWIAARATVAIAAAGALLAVADELTLALVLTIWAALTALITLMRLVRGVQPARVAVPSLLLSVALAVITIVVHDDPVAVTGFFGAYATIRGVFLGIAAFDPRPAASESTASVTPQAPQAPQASQAPQAPGSASPSAD